MSKMDVIHERIARLEKEIADMHVLLIDVAMRAERWEALAMERLNAMNRRGSDAWPVIRMSDGTLRQGPKGKVVKR